LRALKESDYEAMIAKGDGLIEGYRKAADKYGIPLCINCAGTMSGFFFTDVSVENFDTAQQSDTVVFAGYYRGMSEEGVFLQPSQFEGVFLSTAHTDDDIAKTLDAVDKVFRSL